MVARLRTHTRSAHVRLEERLGRFEWLATPETYACMLDRFYGFYVRAEPELARSTSEIAGLELTLRRKTPLLTADLMSLGRTLHQLRALPRIGTIGVGDPARALGALYVLEGATLGGKLIQREVGRRLGLGAASGTAFFGAYGSDAARQWRRFGAVLGREAEEHDLDAICDGASATFAALDRWLVT